MGILGLSTDEEADDTVPAVGSEEENDADEDDVGTADDVGEYGARVGVGEVAGTSVRATEGITVGAIVGAAVGM